MQVLWKISCIGEAGLSHLMMLVTPHLLLYAIDFQLMNLDANEMRRQAWMQFSQI